MDRTLLNLITLILIMSSFWKKGKRQLSIDDAPNMINSVTESFDSLSLSDYSKSEVEDGGTFEKQEQVIENKDLPVQNSGGSLQNKGVPFCYETSCKQFLHQVLDEKSHIHCGYLMKKKSAIHKALRRFFVLSTRHLIYYASKDDIGNALPKGVFHLSETTFVQDPGGSSLAFQVMSDDKRLNLTASTSTEKQQWIQSIRSQLFSSGDSHASNRGAIKCSECKQAVELDGFTLADMAGYLTKRGAEIKNWKKRWCVLKKQHLAYFASPEDVAKHIPKKIVHIESNKVEKTNAFGKEHMFMVSTSQRKFFFCAEDKQTMDQWIAAMEPSKL